MSYHSPRREAAQPQQSTGKCLKQSRSFHVHHWVSWSFVPVSGSSRSFAWGEGVAPLLEGFSDRLLLGLKDVLVERDRLTLGKELGKGQFACPQLHNVRRKYLKEPVNWLAC